MSSEKYQEIFWDTMLDKKKKKGGKLICPISQYIVDLTEKNSEYTSHWNKGIEFISQNKVAVMILAGGAGSRLGFKSPKGMYVCDGLTQSLFEIHIGNLIKIQNKTNSEIPLVIMTSDQTDEQTKKYFNDNNYFKLNKNNVYFFCQSSLPAFNLQGGIIMESKNKMSMSANGNGDMYYSLISSGVYDQLVDKGVEYLQVVTVDNILSKIADPAFFGLTENVDLSVKVMSKQFDHESVGVFVLFDFCLGVIEYSEMNKEMAEHKDDNGERVFDHANIGSYVFRLNKIKEYIDKEKLPYHIARKKIDSVNGKVDGIKLEMFMFDLFKHFDLYTIAKVNRHEEFSPIKNATGVDSPETAVRDFLALNKKLNN
jgi:UDP-N-acetylglucosamine pyrophosphorylase